MRRLEVVWLHGVAAVAGVGWLAAKLLVVLAVLALAAHRDFAMLPRAVRDVETGAKPAAALRSVRWVDRLVLLLALVVLFLAVGIARGR